MGYVAYYRVSTKRQGESGLGLESQRAILCHYLDCDSLVAEFTEVSSGGQAFNRPELQKAIRLCADGGHTLAVAKIDRLSRKTEDALRIWGQLDGRLYSCDIPQDNGRMDKFTLTIFMAIADRERELVGIRTKAALAAAKARGQELGKPENLTGSGRRRGARTNKLEAQRDYRLLVGYIRRLRTDRLSFGAIAGQLNEEGHTTRTGKAFHPATVKRILDRRPQEEL